MRWFVCGRRVENMERIVAGYWAPTRTLALRCAPPAVSVQLTLGSTPGRFCWVVIAALACLLGCNSGQGETAAHATPEVAALIADLRGNDPLLRRSAAEALAKPGVATAEAAPALAAALADDWEIRSQASRALQRMPRAQKATAGPALSVLLEHEDPLIRSSAALILCEMDATSVTVAALLRGVHDEDEAVRAFAELGLRQMGLQRLRDPKLSPYPFAIPMAFPWETLALSILVAGWLTLVCYVPRFRSKRPSFRSFVWILLGGVVPTFLCCTPLWHLLNQPSEFTEILIPAEPGVLWVKPATAFAGTTFVLFTLLSVAAWTRKPQLSSDTPPSPAGSGSAVQGQAT